jgi:cation:H+ antiporter
MATSLAIALLAAGLGLILVSADRLVKGVVGTSAGFGISPFLLSVIFIGFDPENLAVGAVGSFEGQAGIALGSIIGSAMVAIALAFGITALLAPMTFALAPRPILVVPVLAALLLALLCSDGRLSRADGAVLLAGFGPLCLVTVVTLSLIMMTKRVPRWGGGLLVLLYGLFLLGGAMH